MNVFCNPAVTARGARPVNATPWGLIFLVFALPIQFVNASEPVPTLSVAGAGKASAAPDTASFRVGANVTRPTAANALERTNAIIAAVKQALVQRGIAESDIKTVQFNLNPQYGPRQRNQQPPSLVGYRVSHILSVQLDNLKSLGELLDQVIDRGANVLDSVRFTVRDPIPLLDEARRRAVADAQRKAAVVAEAAGISLGSILAIREGAVHAPRPILRGAMEMRATSAVPVAPGESEYSATVQIEYTLQ